MTLKTRPSFTEYYFCLCACLEVDRLLVDCQIGRRWRVWLWGGKQVGKPDNGEQELQE